MRLSELLFKEKRVPIEKLRRAFELQQLVGSRLGSQLLEMGAITEDELLSTLGRQRQTRTVGAAELRNIPPEVVRLVPRKLAERYRIVPFRLEGRTLHLASIDPIDILVEDELAVLTSCLTRTHLALEVRIAQALEHYYRVSAPAHLKGLARRLDNGSGKSGAAKSGAAKAEASSERAPSPPPPKAPSPRSSPVAPEPPKAVAPPPKPKKKTEKFFIELDEEDAALLSGEKSIESLQLAETPAFAAAERRPAARGEETSLFEDEPDEVAGEPASVSKDPEEQLEIAARRLQEIDIRDEIADALLEFCTPFFERRLLFFKRRDEILGWRGEGEGIDEARVRELRFTTTEPSVFLSLLGGSELWLGPLPGLPANQRLIEAMGGSPPKGCTVLPVVLRSKTVCFLYGDNFLAGERGERGAPDAPIPELRRLMSKAAVAFEVYILKNKIRTL